MRPSSLRRTITLLVTLALPILAGTARADEAGTEVLSLPVQLHTAYGACDDGGSPCLTDMQDDKQAARQAFKLALQADPGWGAARAKLVSGIVITSVGSGAAFLLGFTAMMVAAYDSWCSEGDYEPGSCHQDTAPRALGIAALISVGVGLGVGLPLLTSGRADCNAIRKRVTRRLAGGRGWSVGSGPGQAGLGLRYAF